MKTVLLITALKILVTGLKTVISTVLVFATMNFAGWL